MAVFCFFDVQDQDIQTECVLLFHMRVDSVCNGVHEKGLSGLGAYLLLHGLSPTWKYETLVRSIQFIDGSILFLVCFFLQIGHD